MKANNRPKFKFISTVYTSGRRYKNRPESLIKESTQRIGSYLFRVQGVEGRFNMIVSFDGDYWYIETKNIVKKDPITETHQRAVFGVKPHIKGLCSNSEWCKFRDHYKYLSDFYKNVWDLEYWGTPDRRTRLDQMRLKKWSRDHNNSKN